MKNPYEVLGIPEGAPIEQVKAAYKELAKKYQEQGYENGPLADIARRKAQELDEAYDSIIMSGSSQSSYNSTYSGYGRYQQPSGGYYSTAPGYDDIRAKIKSGRLDDAQLLLDGIPESERGGEWFYLKGTIQQRRGWLEEAAKNFESACRLDPSNSTYSAAYNNVMSARSGGYKTRRRDDDDDCSPCRICSGLICADCCCESLGGDLIPCC